MNNPLGPIDPGGLSPFVWNGKTINDTLALLRERNNLRPGGASHTGAQIDGITPAVIVYVKNNHTDHLDPLSVLKLGATTIDILDTELRHELRARPIIGGSAPDAADNPFAITIEGCPVGQVCRAAILGAMVCDVSIVVATDEFATPSSGDVTKLVSATSGPARIIHRDTGTGTRRALVFLTGQGGGGGGGATLTAAYVAAPAPHSIAADNTWEDTGITITLPATGVQNEIYAVVCTNAQISAGAPGHIAARFYDETFGAVIGFGSYIVTSIPVTGVAVRNSAFIKMIANGFVSSPGHVIRLEAYRTSGPTWTTADIVGTVGGIGGTVMAYTKHA